MNQLLKINQKENRKVYLTSDLHIFHDPIWEIPIWKSRGFSSIEESNAGIIDVINNTVGVDDILINLGDITLNCSEFQFEDLLSRIKCRSIYTLFGNHNSPCFSIYRREVENIQSNFGILNYTKYADPIGFEIYPLRYKNIVFLGNYCEALIDGIKCVFSHYPIHSFNGQARGALHFFGHIHSNINTPKYEGRKMDVGFDYHKKPILFDDAKDILYKIPIEHEGHH